MNYPEEHPLHGRDADSIGDMAKAAMRAIDERTPTMSAVYITANLLAIVHELKQLKAEAAERGDTADWRDVLNKVALAMGMRWDDSTDDATEFARKLREERDDLKRRNEIKREAIIHRNERIAELKSTHPPEEWLTRAIATAGAPEGTDWAGLLEHVKNLKSGEDTNFALDAARCEKISDLKHRLETRSGAVSILDSCAVELSMGRGELMTLIPGEVRKLRKRAEVAESERENWQELAHGDYKARCNKYRERAEAAEAKLAELIAAKERSWDMQEVMRRYVLKRLEVSELRVADLEATPTQTDLSRIAADVSRMAAAMEPRRYESALHINATDKPICVNVNGFIVTVAPGDCIPVIESYAATPKDHDNG